MSESGEYIIRLDQPRQTIWGLGVEIQSDSIGSRNQGMPDATTSVPHDLVESERARLCSDMLKGFRYLRLAMGLYLRGLDAERKQIVARWPGQMAELRDLIAGSGIEGTSVEYWSPAPYWKSTGEFGGAGGTLRSTEPAFLDAFGDALARDLEYLEAHGIPLSMWGLQNEPNVDHGYYATCVYSHEQYYAAFKAVAPKIRARFPGMFIHVDGYDGQHGRGAALIRADRAALSLVDGWSWHRIGYDSDDQIDTDYSADACGKPVFNNEFEYLDGQTSDLRCINTAQSIMNWMVFHNAPTWYWLHALKPLRNAEGPGYALGFWREWDNDDPGQYPDLAKGHWTYNPQNWHALAGFLRHMPWDSVRYHVEESGIRKDQRIMAWKTPEGKLVIALSNRQSDAPFTFNIRTGTAQRFAGERYTPQAACIALGEQSGPNLTVELPPLSLAFWHMLPAE